MTNSSKAQDRQKLANLITQWNQDHYDLFELSPPNEVIIIFLNLNDSSYLEKKEIQLFGRSLNQSEPIQVSSGDKSSTNFQNGWRQIKVRCI